VENESDTAHEYVIQGEDFKESMLKVEGEMDEDFARKLCQFNHIHLDRDAFGALVKFFETLPQQSEELNMLSEYEVMLQHLVSNHL
jgi:FPC/CPF motif-containing protein YcgG